MIDVVVADDDDQARASLSRILSRAPEIRVVAEVADGAAALVAVQRLRPNVVVLDVHMPGMNGCEAATHLRSGADLTPIVFITADPEAAGPGMALEATTLLVKSLTSARETIAAVKTAGEGVSRRPRRARRAARPV